MCTPKNIPLAPFKGGIISVIIVFVIIVNLTSCNESDREAIKDSNKDTYYDIPFVQEYHESYMVSDKQDDNEIRSIAVDPESNVWIAAASGVFKKAPGKRQWEEVISGEERGPAYSVVLNRKGEILIGTWNGLYRYSKRKLVKEEGPEPPVSEICSDNAGDYALGPFGIWRNTANVWKKQNYNIARSVRDALCDDDGTLWVATDAGLRND
jgi:ligand-binding sensor domain-containing protein